MNNISQSQYKCERSLAHFKIQIKILYLSHGSSDDEYINHENIAFYLYVCYNYFRQNPLKTILSF
jgi:hypothetical protein